MRVAVLFSGGKDSCYTVMKAREEDMDIELLMTLIPQTNESWLFHHPCIRWTKLQAEAMELPIATYRIEAQGEEERDELRKHLTDVKRLFNIEAIAAGALASEYQKRRIEETAEGLGLKCFTPLWGRNHLSLLYDQVDSGLNIVFVAVAALGLDQSWLGRRLDREAAEQLGRLVSKYGLNPLGEGGEYETFVTDGPLFKKRIVIGKSTRVWNGESGCLEINTAELVEKP